MSMKYEELTGQILEACFEVINELGAGFVESVYERAMLIALRQKGLSADNQYPLKVLFRGQCVGEFFADLLVEERIIVEAKAVKTLLPEHQAQLIHYLKATGLEVGLLVNFGNDKLEFKRCHNDSSSLDGRRTEQK